MKTILTKNQLKAIKGGTYDGDNVFNRTIQCTRGLSAVYDTCCNLPQDTSGQACCERKHGPGAVFISIISGEGICVDSAVVDK